MLVASWTWTFLPVPLSPSSLVLSLGASSCCSHVERGNYCCSSDPANDIVGDNVHDIVGLGADLFRSFANATCAALVLVASPIDLRKLLKALM